MAVTSSHPAPLPLLPGRHVLGSASRLIVDGRPLDGAPRHLSDLPGLGVEDTAAKVCVADLAAVRAALIQGSDPLLYAAWRDILPPRRVSHDGAEIRWSADLIVYQPGTLPGGEPNRSTGHWNTPAQMEIFQVLRGRVLMLMATRGQGGRCVVWHQVREAGELAVVPYGAWHLTYVLDGPAAVFNIYGDDPTVPHSHTSRDAARRDDLKYHAGQPPGVVAMRISSGVQLVALDDSVDVCSTADGSVAIVGLHEQLRPSLAGFYLEASRTRFGRLVRAIRARGSF